VRVPSAPAAPAPAADVTELLENQPGTSRAARRRARATANSRAAPGQRRPDAAGLLEERWQAALGIGRLAWAIAKQAALLSDAPRYYKRLVGPAGTPRAAGGRRHAGLAARSRCAPADEALALVSSIGDERTGRRPDLIYWRARA
jgi:hypothetical protein